MKRRNYIDFVNIRVTAAADMIEYLIEISDEQWRLDKKKKNTAREQRLAKFLGDIAENMERNPDGTRCWAAANTLKILE